MLTIAVALFLVAALGGLVMAVGIFKGATPWMPLALGHGGLAATALVLALLVAIAPGGAPILKYGVATLVVAALGGFFLFSFQLRGKPHPKVVVALHALLAVGGVACLALALLQ
jgi:fucose 4-O-acetylase-like acetyltransferase